MVVGKISEERVKALAKAIGSLGVRALVELEERLDPQYEDMQRLAESVGRGAATVYGMLVALSSYRLTMKGEEWWSCVSETLSSYGRPKDLGAAVDNVVRFLRECKGASVGRDVKIRRVLKVYAGAGRLLQGIMEDPSIVTRSPSEVLNALATALGAREDKKTITFSLKMAYYASRPRGSLTPLTYNIPMPVDVRVACVSITSGIIYGVSDYRQLVRDPREAQKAWLRVAELSSVPTPHMDSLIWVVGWAPRDLPPDEARRVIHDKVSAVAGDEIASLVARELTYRPCQRRV